MQQVGDVFGVVVGLVLALRQGDGDALAAWLVRWAGGARQGTGVQGTGGGAAPRQRGMRCASGHQLARQQ